MFQYTPSIIASAVLLFLFYLVFLIFKPFVTALILAAVIVVIFNPIHTWINHKLPNSLASLISTLLAFIIIIVPGVLIATGIVHETISITQLIESVSLEKIMTHVHTMAGKTGFDLSEIIKDVIQKITSQVGLLAAHIIGNIWNVVIGILITLLATFFFFRDKEKMMNVVKSFPINSIWIENLIKEIVSMIKSNIAASFICASIQGTIGGLAFAWFELPAPILWGTVMGFFSLFPFIGSWLVWIPAASALLLSGRIWDAVILIIIGIAVVNPVDNILRPAIIASATHLNGLLVFIALLGGVQAFGVSGLLLGPIALILVVGLFRSSKNYINANFFKLNSN